MKIIVILFLLMPFLQPVIAESALAADTVSDIPAKTTKKKIENNSEEVDSAALNEIKLRMQPSLGEEQEARAKSKFRSSWKYYFIMLIFPVMLLFIFLLIRQRKK